MYIVERLVPDPVAGLPDVAVHANVYGVVPPDPVAVNVTGVPTVPVVGPLTVTASASGLMTMLVDADDVAEAASVIETDTVNVPFAL